MFMRELRKRFGLRSGGCGRAVSCAVGLRRVLMVFMCICVFCGVDVCRAWDLAPLLLNGELWNIRRDQKFRGVNIIENDEKTSDITAEDSVCFGDIKMTAVTAEWVEEGESPEDGGKKAEEGGREAGDAQFRKLGKLVCFVYSRGDNDVADAEEFQERVRAAREEVSRITGVKMKKVQEDAGKSKLITDVVQWETEHGLIRLSYGVRADRKVRNSKGDLKGRPEFIRLTIAVDRAMMNKGGAKDKTAAFSLKDSLKHEEDGTVWITGIPMVNQGDKGYCVPATLARVFAYYGMSHVDMDSLAAVCNSDADDGTSVSGMEKSMEDIGRRYHIKIKPLYKCDRQQAVGEYNEAAKRAKKTEVDFREKGWVEVVDPELWKTVRAKKKGDVRKWFTSVRRQIDSGIPVVWSVFASGFYNHEAGGSTPAGGPHMRMIIGYNAKKDMIIYSDSWGKFAERREMTVSEAFSNTGGTWVVR